MGRKRKNTKPQVTESARIGWETVGACLLLLAAVLLVASFFYSVHSYRKTYAEAYSVQYTQLISKGDDYRQVLEIYNECKSRPSGRVGPNLRACQDEAEVLSKHIDLKHPIGIIMRDIREADALAFMNAR